jgi:hypothetical protein
MKSGRSAQRASALIHGLSTMWDHRLSAVRQGRESEHLSRAGQSVKALLTGLPQSRERLHRASLSGSAVRKVAARATRKCLDSRALSNLRPQAVGDSIGRVGEQLSRAGQSANALLTGSVQSRARLHRASLSGSAGRKVAAHTTRKLAKYHGLGHDCPSHFGSITYRKPRDAAAAKPIVVSAYTQIDYSRLDTERKNLV